MKLSDVKRSNRLIGVLLAVGLTYASGLDGLLRRSGGPAFMLICLVPMFVLFPMGIELLERFVRKRR